MRGSSRRAPSRAWRRPAWRPRPAELPWLALAALLALGVLAYALVHILGALLMKRPFFAAIVAALALSACATPPAGGPAPTPAQAYAAAARSTLLAAETAFNVAATAELDAKALGLLTGKKAGKADATRRQAYAALLAARAVYAGGRQPDLAALLALTNQLLVLAGKPPVPAAP